MSTLWQRLQDRRKLTAELTSKTDKENVIPLLESSSLSDNNPFDAHHNEPVRDSAELQRVLALPRRAHDVNTLAGDVELLSQRFRRPGGTRTLRPLQAAALLQAEEAGGLLGAIEIGAGKTDISLLLPEMMGSKVAVLLVPASLKSKLLDIEYPALSKEWRLPSLPTVYSAGAKCTLHVLSYSQLSAKSGFDILEKIKPDLIICDEGQALKDPGATRTKRFRRFMKKYRGKVRLCVLSGSLITSSIRDFAHLSDFALDGGSPLPRDFPSQMAWAAALDPVDNPSPPGALLRLCKSGESVRSGFQRRLVETKGIVASSSIALLTKLEIIERQIQVPKSIQAALKTLREDWVMPNEEQVPDSLSFYRHSRELAAGLYLQWVWPDEQVWSWDYRVAWLKARAEWHREVRERLKGDAKVGLDSQGLIEDAVKSGQLRSTAYEEWDLVAREFRERTKKQQPDTVPVWVDDYLVRDATAFGHESPSIIWYEQDDFGRQLAKAGGFKWYGAGKKASAEIGREDGSRTIVASVYAHHKGHNLQGFNRMLFTSAPSSNTLWEQATGRAHRSGQQSAKVRAYVYLQTEEMKRALSEARKKAEFVAGALGAAQRLTTCDFSFLVAQ